MITPRVIEERTASGATRLTLAPHPSQRQRLVRDIEAAKADYDEAIAAYQNSDAYAAESANYDPFGPEPTSDECLRVNAAYRAHEDAKSALNLFDSAEAMRRRREKYRPRP